MATQQSKNKWWIDSGSVQKRQVLSLKSFLLLRISLVKSLLLPSSHRKIWILGGTLNFHVVGIYTGTIPRKLSTEYRVCTEKTPLESYIQIILSISSLKFILLAIEHKSSHWSIRFWETDLLKVSLRLTPSHTWLIVAPFSFTMTYRCQNWIARLEVPNQWSSQNLILRPFPTFHWKPKRASLAASKTPFQKKEAPRSGQQKRLGCSVLYLSSTICFQSTLLFKWYLWIHAAKRLKFRVLRSGIPSPPNSFFCAIIC